MVKIFYTFIFAFLLISCRETVDRAGKSTQNDKVHPVEMLAQSNEGIEESNIYYPIVKSGHVDRPYTLYDKYRKKAAPSNGVEASLNPPTLKWPAGNEGSSVYQVELSQDKNFSEENTIKSNEQIWCFFNPHKNLESGKWYWRYKTDGKGFGEVYDFQITEETPKYLIPNFDQFVQNIPQSRPYMMTYGKTMQEFKENILKNTKLSQEIISSANKILHQPVLNNATADKSKYTERNWEKVILNGERNKLPVLNKAYLLTQDRKYFENAILRMREILTWDQYGLSESQNIRFLALSYDTFHSELPVDLKKDILRACEKFLAKYYKKWPGKTETRQFDNHFWQMEMSAFFFVALATIDSLEVSQTCLEYAYGVFNARFPVLGGNDGGWANGLGYFGVNDSTVFTMAYFLKSIGKVDVFKMPWYQNLPEYYFYCSPSGGPIDGFGDSQERRNNDGQGAMIALMLGLIEDDELGLYHAGKVFQRTTKKLDKWFLLANGFDYDPAKQVELPKLEQAREFEEVGVVAMHTDVSNPENDLAVYFRSSPYGANGHMIANQNCFNISYKGERIFYSSGYYTNFADPHSLTSYKHTRANNGILINGKGQSYGHEGYGWIKRYANIDEISYACGDASRAYKEMTDEQWTMLMNKNGIPIDEQMGDVGLMHFDRHIALLRPNTVVIYDDLEAKESVSWEKLMHTYKKSELKNNALVYNTGKSTAVASVWGSQELQSSLTDQFFIKPVDKKKKYKKGVPNQFHSSFKSTANSNKMRYLTIIQLGDESSEIEPIEREGDIISVGDWKIAAELNTDKESFLIASNGKSKLHVNKIPKEVNGHAIGQPKKPSSLLTGLKNGKYQSISTEDRDPVINE